MSEPSEPLPDRAALEEKLGHLNTMAKRYSPYDPKYVRLHEQMNETLDAWQMRVLADGLV